MKLLIFLALLWNITSYASGKKSSPPKENIVDKTHSRFGKQIQGLANRLDSLFGAERTDDERNRSSLRVITTGLYQEDKRSIYDYQLKLNLRLPTLENYFKFKFENKNAKKNSKSSKGKNRKKKKPGEYDWIFRSDLGLNVGPPPFVFSRARARKNIKGINFIHRFSEELEWASNNGFTETTEFFSDKSLTNKLLFRISHTKIWRISSEDVTLSQGPSLIHSISARDAMSYNARALTVLKNFIYFSGYQLNISYRRKLYSNWLFGEIIPALDFPKENSFRRTPSILVKLESFFGHI